MRKGKHQLLYNYTFRAKNVFLSLGANMQQDDPVVITAGHGGGVAGSGLAHAEGGFTLHTGEFKASWDVDVEKKRFTANMTTPDGTAGTMYMPITEQGSTQKVVVNGQTRSDARLQNGFF